MPDGESGRRWGLGLGCVIALVAGLLFVLLLVAGAAVAGYIFWSQQAKPVPPAPMSPRRITAELAVTVSIEGSDDGTISYHVADDDPVVGEKALAELIMKRYTPMLGGTVNRLSVKLLVTDFRGVTEEKLQAARAACEAAGAQVEELPALPDRRFTILFSAKGQEDLEIELTGVRDEVLQFRFEGRDIEGTPALVEALQARIAALAKERGGPVLVFPRVQEARGVKLSREQVDALDKALFAAGPEVQAIRGGGGRRIKVMRICPLRITGPESYLLREQKVQGLDALAAEVAKALAKAIADNKDADECGCEVRYRHSAAFEPDEKQIEAVRRAVEGCGASFAVEQEAGGEGEDPGDEH